MSSIYGLVKSFTLCQSSQESTSESVSGSIGVDNFAAVDFVDLVNIHLDITRSLSLSHDGRLSTLCDDDHSFSLAILFGQAGQVLGDCSDIGSLHISNLPNPERASSHL